MRQTDEILSHKQCIFAGDLTIGPRSFWSWFHVNRFTFYDDMYEKRLLHFRFLDTSHLDFKFAPQLLLSRLSLHKFEISVTLRFRVN